MWITSQTIGFLHIPFLQSLFQFPTRSEKSCSIIHDNEESRYFFLSNGKQSRYSERESRQFRREIFLDSRALKLLPPPPPRPRGRLFSFCRRLENFLARRQPRIHEYFVGIEKLDLVVEEREGLSFHEMEINILVKFLIYIYIYYKGIFLVVSNDFEAHCDYPTILFQKI